MRWIVLAGTLALVTCLFSLSAEASPPVMEATQATIQPSARAEPLLVVIEEDPWAMVIGSDSPKFALYDDGVVIYRKETGYHAVRLNADELAVFMSALQPEALQELAGGYSISTWTDQPTTDILLRIGTGFTRISVYGSLDRVVSAAGKEPMADPSRLPQRLLDTYGLLSAFERTDAVPWSPEAIEVLIWPYEYAPDESIVWPSRWPGLTHAETRPRGSSYSLFVPTSERAALREFLEGRRERGAVLIDGRKWAVSTRLPFPREDRWMKPGPVD